MLLHIDDVQVFVQNMMFFGAKSVDETSDLQRLSHSQINAKCFCYGARRQNIPPFLFLP